MHRSSFFSAATSQFGSHQKTQRVSGGFRVVCPHNHTIA
jgi:hypothetical protein